MPAKLDAIFVAFGERFEVLPFFSIANDQERCILMLL
jgi:hypothetical protein